MTLLELAALCTILVCYDDPSKPSPACRAAVEQLADREAKAHGFQNWVAAYHALPKHP